MNILGFNPGHHSSVCLLQDGELKYFIQEERLTRKKYDSIPFKSFINILENYKIDYVTFSTPSVEYPTSSEELTPYWYILASKYNPNVKFISYNSNHHICHGTHSFLNSGFNRAIGIVIDGMGSFHQEYEYRETESIFEFSYPLDIKTLYQNITHIPTKVNMCRAYEAITMHLGWSRDEAGKTMGLSSYGKLNNTSPKFIENQTASSVFYHKPSNTYSDGYVNIPLPTEPKNWHYNPHNISNVEKDIAYQIQIESQQLVGDYIEKAVQETGLNQICCAGGYFLNCVTNYYLIKRFPNIKFYFEPIANDAGTSIGASQLVWHHLNKNNKTILPLKSLYLGKQYSKKELLEGIKSYLDN